MLYTRTLAVVAILIPVVLFAQTPTSAPAETMFFAVSYFEARPSAAKAARETLAQYREASRMRDGLVRVEFFEQVGRPGHFATVETWRDQPTFDARDIAAQQQLLAALQPIRVSGYDQRPYKTLTTAPAAGAVGRQAVHVIAHVDVTQSPQVPVLLRRLADASRQEAGNLRFDIVQHATRANHFTVIESWRDQQALDSHADAAHTRQYRDELQPMTGSPLDERVYTVVE